MQWMYSLLLFFPAEYGKLIMIMIIRQVLKLQSQKKFSIIHKVCPIKTFQHSNWPLNEPKYVLRYLLKYAYPYSVYSE